MENPAVTIYCSNPHCQAPNAQNQRFCQQCRTPLLKRYLWAVGEGINAYRPGEVIAERYLLVHQRIVLDTQPGQLPQMRSEIPSSIAPYLKLSPYRLHIPQVYEQLTTETGRHRSNIWLLEYGMLPTENQERFAEGKLLPELIQVWSGAPALRQLNWLWQIAGLWQPLNSEGVASSLLKPSLLCVNGSLVQLLELQPDDDAKDLSLKQLGQLWSQWVAGASPDIAEFLQQLCTQLQEGQISGPDQLIATLDQALQACGRSQQRSYQIFTLTDIGTNRHHNEDACYPPGGKLVSSSDQPDALAIVCDGIGGHEGGEIASNVAIDATREGVEKLSLGSNQRNPTVTTLELERSTCIANDLISQRNDSEQRYERQRMGTTLVMTLAVDHEMYVTHVGDSRVYWVTRTGCHQITLDDDVASREVRLGYTLYRDAIQYPAAGSLVQALGMSSSVSLHPTVQRLVLDEDCVFLLCSDGLSDYDRVEQYWETELLPILTDQTDIATVGNRLIEIANTKNGHDNVTVALVYCQVQPITRAQDTVLALPQLKAPPSPSVKSAPTQVVESTSSQMKTQQLSPRNSARRPRQFLFAVVLLLGLGGLLYLLYLWLPRGGRFNELLSGSSPIQEPVVQPTGVNPENTPTLSPLKVEVGDLLEIREAIALQPENFQIPEDQQAIGKVPARSILKVTRVAAKTETFTNQQETWLRLKVCSISQTNSSEPTQQEILSSRAEASRSKEQQVPPDLLSQRASESQEWLWLGAEGWIRANAKSVLSANQLPTSSAPSQCAALAP